MADNQQNPTGPGSQAQAQLDATSRAKREQGGLVDLLKEQEKILKGVIRSYDTIEGQLETLNKETINVSKINTQLSKAKAKEFELAKKLVLQQKALTKGQKITGDMYIRQRMRASKLEGVARQVEEERLETQFQQYDLSVQQYISSKTALDVAKQTTSFAEKKLEAEKRVAKQLGITGRLSTKFAKSLGVGQGYAEELTSRIRDAEKGLRKKVTLGEKLGLAFSMAKDEVFEAYQGLNGWQKAGLLFGATLVAASKSMTLIGKGFSKTGSFLKGMSEDSGNVFSNLTSGLSSFASKIPIVGGLLGGVIDGFASILDLITGVDDYMVKTGRQLGLTSTQAQAVNREFSKMSFSTGDIYMNSKRFWESQMDLSEVLGVNNIASEKALKINMQLKELAGLDAETRGEIYRISKLNNESQDATVKKVLSQVAGLQKATGVSLNYQKVLKEAASQSGYLGLQFAKYPEKLTKALLTTKALGLELKKVDGIADSLLDYESSIQKEFEAQLLTGRNINLQRARELSLANDMEGLAVEIAKTVGTTGDFMKMNRIEQQALTDAVGMSRDEVSEMLKNQEIFGKLGTRNMETTMKMVKEYRSMGKEQELLNKLKSDEMYQSLINMSVQEDLMKLIEKIKQSVVDFMQNSNIFTMVKDFMNYLSNPANVQATIKKIRDIMADVADVIGTMVVGIARFLNDLPWWLGGGKAISDSSLSYIEKTFGSLSESIKSFDVVAKSTAQSVEESTQKQLAAQQNTKGFRSVAAPITGTDVNDAVIFPESNRIIKKDPLDYTIFTKDPQGLVAGSGIESNKLAIETLKGGLEEIKGAIVQAMNSSNRNTPMILNVNTTMDAYASMRQMKISYDGDIGSNIDQKTAPYNNMRTNMG